MAKGKKPSNVYTALLAFSFLATASAAFFLYYRADALGLFQHMFNSGG